MASSILIVDDEKNIREGLKRALVPQGYEVYLASDGKEGLGVFISERIDLAILDLQMPKLPGLQLLKRLQEIQPGVPVIFITGYGSVETAVEAMRLGAYDFLTKPINLEKLDLIIARALRMKKIVRENELLTDQVKTHELEQLLLGESKAMQELRQLIKQVARSKANVHIYGESGTGKEVVCDAIHHLSGGGKQGIPLVKVNCAALVPNLLESELFGHEKGAFTGAHEVRIGRFEAAQGGLLFLDEVSEIPPFIQVKLLRVLQEKVIERVGGTKPIKLSFRLISAANRDLKAAVAAGQFRADLYYRLNVLQLRLPPLRERRGDIEFLSKHFLKFFLRENGMEEFEVTPQVYSALRLYSWPGNVRELRNILERMVVLAPGETKKLTLEDLRTSLKSSLGKEAAALPLLDKQTVELEVGMSLAEAEKKFIEQTLKTYAGNQSKAAKVLGLGRSTLHRKIK